MTGTHMRRLTVGAILLLPPLMLVGCAKDDAPLPPTITTKSGVEMVLIPAGSFEMGSKSGREEEQPAHIVRLDSFLMDKYPVTQGEYEKVGEDGDPPFANPSHFPLRDDTEMADKKKQLPVEQIKWPAAVEFCNTRSRLEGLKPCYSDKGVCDFEADGYRLPTEAEWEYACRAGTNGDYSFGNELRQLGSFAWFADNSNKRTHPVGVKKPNPWGLYDMHGNVAQWCNDIYDKNYYKSSLDQNPRGPATGKEYVLRGGSWKSSAEDVRSAARLGESPGFSDACLARDAIGFRCVRKAPPEGSAEK